MGTHVQTLPRSLEAVALDTAEGRWRMVAAQWGVGGAGFAVAGLLGASVDGGTDGLLLLGGVLCVVAVLMALLSTTGDAEMLAPVLTAGAAFAAAAALAAKAPPTPVALLVAWVAAQAWCVLSARAAACFTLFAIVLCGAVALVQPMGANALAWWVATTAGLLVVASVTAALRVRADRLTTRLHLLADRDETTGVLNRRGLSTRLAAALARQRRHGEPVALVLADIDGFDALHNHFGAAASDRVLRRFAASCDGELRGSDALGRIGGERFALLLPDVDAVAAAGVAERIRARLATSLSDPDGTPITASFGVAVCADAATAERLLDTAAELLATAQRDGHDLVRTDTLAH